MRNAKPLFADDRADTLPEPGERELALEYIAEAWNSAEDDGVESLALAHAALFAALATLVRLHGEDGAATLVETLPVRVRAGEYSLDRNLQ